MSYTIMIIKDKYSNTEKEVYSNTLDRETSIKLITDLINHICELEQEARDYEGDY